MAAHQHDDVSASGLDCRTLVPVADATGRDFVGLRPYNDCIALFRAPSLSWFKSPEGGIFIAGGVSYRITVASQPSPEGDTWQPINIMMCRPPAMIAGAS